MREAHHERRLLMHVVAPHLVRRLPFLFPLYEDGPYRPWFVQSGILLYSTMARARLNGLVSVERAHRMVPQLRGEQLRSCAFYADAWTNDGRLTLANVRAAADAGRPSSTTPRSSSCAAGEGADVSVDGRDDRGAREGDRQRDRPVGRPRAAPRGSGGEALDAARARACTCSSTAARTGTPR